MIDSVYRTSGSLLLKAGAPTPRQRKIPQNNFSLHGKQELAKLVFFIATIT